MSATNRGAEREEEDAYLTHGWCVERLLEIYRLPEGASVCDPCAAGGELLEAIKKLRPDLQLYAFELREKEGPKLEALKVAGVLVDYGIGNFLAISQTIEEPCFDYVITNPPYSLAREMVEATIRVVKVAAIHLLRINFLGAVKRRDFHAATKPGLRILPNRPCFTGWGSDATEYGWFIYGDPIARGTWEICALTPEKVISAWNDAAKIRYPHLKPELVKARKAAKKAAEALPSPAGHEGAGVYVPLDGSENG